jgi:hypothetical protein
MFYVRLVERHKNTTERTPSKPHAIKAKIVWEVVDKNLHGLTCTPYGGLTCSPTQVPNYSAPCMLMPLGGKVSCATARDAAESIPVFKFGASSLDLCRVSRSTAPAKKRNNKSS